MARKQVRSEDPIPYGDLTLKEDEIIRRALEILEARHKPGMAIAGPQGAKDYLRLKYAALEHEIFGVIWLDTRHQILAVEELFRGTIDAASVYPREVVKAALSKNAANCVLFHNHPSGSPEPSSADESLTKILVEALKLIGVRALDHIVVGTAGTVSFAERGIL